MQCLKLCLVTHSSNKPFSLYKNFLVRAVNGGVTSVQLREKNPNKNAIRAIACELKAILASFKVPLIINDHVDIALQVEADGVHLGQSDILPQEARKILGPKKIIGWSIETQQQLDAANNLSCIDYVAASAVFASQKTKTDCKTIWGIQGLKEITQRSKHPVVAIGGIDASNVTAVMQAGVCGVAIISAIHDHPDPKAASALLINKIKNEEDNHARPHKK